MSTAEEKRSIRRQAERIAFDIYHDPDLQWDGFFCRMDIGPFSRANGWRNWQVRRALYELEKAGYLSSLSVDYGRATFRIEPPNFLRRLLID